jgi:hypothetical protein
MLFLLTAVNSTTIILQTSSGDIQTIYFPDVTMNPLFEVPPPTFSCRNNNIFIYFENYTEYSQNKPYFLNISGLNQSYQVVISPMATRQPNKLLFSEVVPFPSLWNCSGDCNITMLNNCQSPLSFGGVTISIATNPAINLNYSIVCDANLT